MSAVSTASGPGARPAPGESPLARLTSPVLVGRDRELSLLVEAAANPPAVVLVEGEAGVGSGGSRRTPRSGGPRHAPSRHPPHLFPPV